ncbi:B12-binding domain-containing radical SAM protein [Novispirillum itersonii]|uniref:B12-binding domain-containing radical SAM protein n=1 Tax=Novispirillum itersonii TaxID=189 RepID=UPI0003778A19|nr:B12-binding domain-containing radical SAM protein [Novispirillum itersonii]
MTGLYLINPYPDSQAYFGTDVFIGSPGGGVQLVADLAIATVAAMVPPDMPVRLCDEQISPADPDPPESVIALTGKTPQVPRMLELAAAYRQRGKVVVIGGPYASLAPERIRPHCDVLVRGEIEEIAPRLFADLRDGTWQAEYTGTRADLSASPLPRWDLYPNHRALMGTVQTSRGCPFPCEFCDVPTYVGRKQRHKDPPQVIRELDALYAHGYRSIFIADDNFSATRARARALLEALIDWNHSRPDGPVGFTTQMSIDVARDEDMLRLSARAGIQAVFIGLETPSADSLRETGKRQNLQADPMEMVGRFLDHHIMVISGLIVGFDADGPDIFDRQRAFTRHAPIPVFTLGALAAPEGSPLHRRLSNAGRLQPDQPYGTGQPWSTNILPAQMSPEALLTGVRTLALEMYHPDAFADRVMALIDRLGPYQGPPPATAPAPLPATLRQLDDDVSHVVRGVVALGPAERAMVSRLGRHVLTHRPETLPVLRNCLRFYAQIRHVYGRAF